MLSSHERVLAALELREPDRVPVFDMISEFKTTNEILGKKPGSTSFLFSNRFASRALDRFLPLVNRNEAVASLLGDGEIARFSRDAAAASVKMGYDCAWIPFIPSFRTHDSKNAFDIFGRSFEILLDEDGNLAAPMYKGGLIASPDDWKNWDKRPILRLPERANRQYTELQKEYGRDIFILGFGMNGLFENTWQPMGFDRFVVAVRKEKEFVRRFISFYADLYCVLIDALADAGIPGLVYGDDMAYRSGPMLNPKLLDELYGDSIRRICEKAHSMGMKVMVHCCGDATALLEWYAGCGLDAVHPIEPTAGMELATAKQMVGDRMCLVGNIDITHVLVDATKDEVFEAVRRAIFDAGRGGGYILGPDHSHSSISVERLRWMVEAAHKYGTYPLEAMAQ